MSAKVAKKKRDLTFGDEAIITGKHPWANCRCELLNFEPYGPSGFNWTGWRVRILENDQECYVKPEQLRRI